jgi:hypothetical protein
MTALSGTFNKAAKNRIKVTKNAAYVNKWSRTMFVSMFSLASADIFLIRLNASKSTQNEVHSQTMLSQHKM